MDKLNLCQNHCKFPICDSCEANQERHKPECDLVRSWKFANNAKYSKHLFRGIYTLKCYFRK